MVRGLPRMCIRTTPTPAEAHNPAMPSDSRAATSFTATAPASMQRCATPGFEVLIETRTPSPARRSTTPTTRPSSSASSTSPAPGRVDSPPTSTKSAPSSRSSSPCSTAAPSDR